MPSMPGSLEVLVLHIQPLLAIAMWYATRYETASCIHLQLDLAESFCCSAVHITLLHADMHADSHDWSLLQTLVGSVYKALKAQQNQLGVKMPDVKSSVSLSPLSASELAAAFSTAIQACLVHQGWSLLEREHLLNSSTWHPATGSEQTCHSVKLSVTCFAPSTVLLHIQTGAAFAGKGTCTILLGSVLYHLEPMASIAKLLMARYSKLHVAAAVTPVECPEPAP